MNLKAEKAAGAAEKSGTWFSNPGLESSKADADAKVGRYLTAAPSAAPRSRTVEEEAEKPPPKRQKAVAYGNFDAW